MASDPKTNALYPNRDHKSFGVILGPGRFIVYYTMPSRDEFCALFTDVGHGPPGEPNVWNSDGDVNDLRKRFNGFAPAIQKLLSYVSSCDKWQITHMPPDIDWISSSGKVIVVGDAAHAMVPHAAQVGHHAADGNGS